MKKLILKLVLVIALLPGVMWAAIPATERAALIALYNATNGDNWKKNSGWKTPPLHSDGFAKPGTENTWEGITVIDNHVTNICFVDNGLTGNIPQQLGNLKNVNSLYLQRNQLSGNIPSSLGSMSSLMAIYLSSNALTGNIPSTLGNLSALLTLDLCDNALTGNIPATCVLSVTVRDKGM